MSLSIVYRILNDLASGEDIINGQKYDMSEQRFYALLKDMEKKGLIEGVMNEQDIVDKRINLQTLSLIYEFAKVTKKGLSYLSKMK